MKSNPAVPGGSFESKPTWSNTFGCSATSAFFVLGCERRSQSLREGNPMEKIDITMAQQVAQAASVFQLRRTGYAPRAVTVVLSDDTLVVTLHEALSPAEKALARTPEGAAQVQDFHRQLFKNSADLLRQEIKRITGVAVGEAAAEIEPTTGAVVHAFTTGNMVQVFQLAGRISAETWNNNRLDDPSQKTEVLLC
jgi:uncharacterized protein YbcI